MLELRNIKKDYPAGDQDVHALKGISLTFEDSEFVSILGPSGCGKTTMLNIIGGLDKYSDGDLLINGRSTKEYKDRDWDTYRNHSVGFVFQNYNLIPHQSVLQNVELALSLSGVSKKERRRRAIEALASVGLETQLKKKPGEMSGGQMQRVAIARAIVNNPDIVLADEPTGALDSETSVQVMEILKKISKDRLVIMVTHNPELAEKYSTRIVRMLDGEIKSDSNPCRAVSAPMADDEKKKLKKQKKPSMSFATSFGLSLKNLFTKKGRTALTSFAGSIGIIGIALVYAVSHGTTAYINTVQEDTLSSYPLTLESKHVDIGTLMSTFMSSAEAKEDHDLDSVYQKQAIYDMVNALSSIEERENDLASFKKYIEEKREVDEEGTGLKAAISGIQYTYDMDISVYTKDPDGNVVESDTREMTRKIMLKYFGRNTSLSDDENNSSSSGSGGMMSMFAMGGASSMWNEMLRGDNGRIISPLLEKQYDVIYGSWPSSYNEVVLVVDENNELDDVTLYALGLKTEAEIDEIVDAAINKETVEHEMQKWSFEDICNMEFRIVLNADCYVLDESTGLYNDIRGTDAGLKYLYDEKGITIKVSGIIRPSDDAVSAMLNGSIGYTTLLTDFVIENSSRSDVVKAQAADPSTDIFTGLPFSESTSSMSDKEKEATFREYVEDMNTEKKAETFVKIQSIPSDEWLEETVSQTMEGAEIENIREMMVESLSAQIGTGMSDIEEYVNNMSDEDILELYRQAVTEQVTAVYAQNAAQSMAAVPAEQLSLMLDSAMEEYTTEECARYYDEVLVFSDSTYENNMKLLGNVDPDKPYTINLYASTFENKDVIEEAIAEYNRGVDELSQITYTDYVGIMMSSITTIIDAITYVLIAFISVSLVVSSIMIGVITLISVQERTKEIGILRAIGASKRNVSSMFNAETVIIGFTSGALGVLITYLLCIPINLILRALTGINSLNAFLPIPAAIILIVISMALTLISGIIPSRSAAKKDPVVALRTE